MSKPYIRKRGKLDQGNIHTFECKRCSKIYDNKYEFKQHLPACKSSKD